MIIRGKEFSEKQACEMEQIIEDGNSGRYNQHYSYPEFVEKCTQKGMGYAASELWMCLLNGYHIQKDKHEAASQEIKKFLKEKPDALELPENLYSDFLKEITDNKFFTRIVEIAAEHLRVPDGKSLALWTGGIQVSRQLQKAELADKLCVLESTNFGEILNTVPVTRNWIREEGLWNLISKKFVEQYEGEWVHIYFRNVNEVSILFAQELKELKKKNVKVVWHPLITLPNGELREVLNISSSVAYADVDKIHLQFVGNTQDGSFKNAMMNAFEAWENKIKFGSPIANSRSLKGYYSHDYVFFRPPYAVNPDYERELGLRNFYVVMSEFM